MPIYPLLQREAFDAELVAMLGDVFEDVLKTLGLVDRADPLTEMVARRVIDLARAGVRDREHLKYLTMQAFQGGART